MRVRFGDCVLDSDTRQLFVGRQEVHLQPKAFQFLDLLLQNRPKAVSKDEIHEKLWPGTFVSDGTLTSLLAEVREAIGDDAHEPRFVRTLHRFGYAFSGTAEEVRESPSDPAVAKAGLLAPQGPAPDSSRGGRVDHRTRSRSERPPRPHERLAPPCAHRHFRRRRRARGSGQQEWDVPGREENRLIGVSLRPGQDPNRLGGPDDPDLSHVRIDRDERQIPGLTPPSGRRLPLPTKRLPAEIGLARHELIVVIGIRLVAVPRQVVDRLKANPIGGQRSVNPSVTQAGA